MVTDFLTHGKSVFFVHIGQAAVAYLQTQEVY